MSELSSSEGGTLGDEAGSAVAVRHVVRIVAELRPADRRRSRFGIRGDAVREAGLARVGSVSDRVRAVLARSLTVHGFRLVSLRSVRRHVVATALSCRHGSSSCMLKMMMTIQTLLGAQDSIERGDETVEEKGRFGVSREGERSRGRKSRADESVGRWLRGTTQQLGFGSQCRQHKGWARGACGLAGGAVS
ncbi:hypothetical protein L1887_53336 [Cichorium endivia]|nr:hypothetical protein L1887_53336 [Cichorium endivia]